MVETSLRDVAAHGARIRFEEAGSGPPVLLLHDLLSSRLEWRGVVDALAPRHRVIACDLPGFGESEKPPPSRYAYTLDAFAESICDLAGALGLGRVSVCGHGLGGSVALALAARHPSVVERLVLVAPYVHAAPRSALARLAQVPVVGGVAFKQLAGSRLFRAHFRQAFAPAASVPWDQVATHLDQWGSPAGREAAQATLESLFDLRPVSARTGSVRAPSLVVWGRSDALSPAEGGRKLARELADARLELLECGHSPAEELPEAFAELVGAFLAKRARGWKAA
jgi:pimeloyl-ACP methyl ester carboxylesterase